MLNVFRPTVAIWRNLYGTLYQFRIPTPYGTPSSITNVVSNWTHDA